MTRSHNPRIVTGPQLARPGPRERVLQLVVVLLVASLVGLGAHIYALRDSSELRADFSQASADLNAAWGEVESLQQQLAVSQRSAQVTETANDSLREQIVRLEQDISGLRADVEFYQRLLGSGGSSNGLAVHALQLEPTRSERVYRFALTMSQNLKKAQVVKGRVHLAVDGVSGDRPLRLEAQDVSLQTDAGELDYEFKYFQQLSGSFALPDGFQPDRVSIRLEPQGARSNPTVTREFIWTELMES